MSATDFKAPLRDLQFALFEHIRVQDLPNAEYADFDQEMYSMVLSEAAKLAEETPSRNRRVLLRRRLRAPVLRWDGQLAVRHQTLARSVAPRWVASVPGS